MPSRHVLYPGGVAKTVLGCAQSGTITICSDFRSADTIEFDQCESQARLIMR
jgi:hypothetical protein